MLNFKKTVGSLLVLSLIPLAMAGCGESAVSYSLDVKPIIDQNCIQCHQKGGEGEIASGFNMSTYAGLLEGTRFGPMIIAGDVEGSNLLVLVEGRADPSIRMPHGEQKPIAKEDIQTIKSWIEQGAKDN